MMRRSTNSGASEKHAVIQTSAVSCIRTHRHPKQSKPRNKRWSLWSDEMIIAKICRWRAKDRKYKREGRLIPMMMTICQRLRWRWASQNSHMTAATVNKRYFRGGVAEYYHQQNTPWLPRNIGRSSLWYPASSSKNQLLPTSYEGVMSAKAWDLHSYP